MKTLRQAKILEIIEEKNIETQSQLMEALILAGFDSTQATISRDIKDLRLVKEQTASGIYRYVSVSAASPHGREFKLNNIMRECATSFDFAGNIVVIKTLPGLAPAAGSAIDSMRNASIVGSLSGDDTAIVIMRDNQSAESFCNELKKSIL